MDHEIVAFAVDVGSRKEQALTWVCSLSRDRCGNDLEGLVDAVTQHLGNGNQVALGFECVLFLPCPDAPDMLCRARPGECTPETQNRAFTAAAGACATMTGLPQLAWVLREIKRHRPETTATTRWSEFQAGTDLFIWEAFVSGFEKGATHHADAVLAVEAFEKSLPIMASASRVTAEHPISLAGSLILWAGLSQDSTLVHDAATVLRPVFTADEFVANKRRVMADRDSWRHRRRQMGGANDQ